MSEQRRARRGRPPGAGGRSGGPVRRSARHRRARPWPDAAAAAGARAHACGLVTLVEERQLTAPGRDVRGGSVCRVGGPRRVAAALARAPCSARSAAAAGAANARDGGEDRRGERRSGAPTARQPRTARRRRRAARPRPLPARAAPRRGRLRRRLARARRAPRPRGRGQAHRHARRRRGRRAPSARRSPPRGCRTRGSSRSTRPGATTRPSTWSPSSCAGATLGELEREGALSDRDVLRIGLALCDALAHAHGRGVVHRDVKPAT